MQIHALHGGNVIIQDLTAAPSIRRWTGTPAETDIACQTVYAGNVSSPPRGLVYGFIEAAAFTAVILSFSCRSRKISFVHPLCFCQVLCLPGPLLIHAESTRLHHRHKLSLQVNQPFDIILFQSSVLMVTLPRSMQSLRLHISKRLLIVRPTIII